MAQFRKGDTVMIDSEYHCYYDEDKEATILRSEERADGIYYLVKTEEDDEFEIADYLLYM